MNSKRKVLLLLAQILLLVFALVVFPANLGVVNWYSNYIYHPTQWLRDLLLGFIPFSMGDIAYVAAGVFLIALLIKWIRYIIIFKSNKQKLAVSALNTINIIVLIYLFFIFGWGANYYKQPLAESWALQKEGVSDTLHLAAYDSVLITRLNALAPQLQPMTRDEVNEKAINNYRQFTNTPLSGHGLNVKTSIFSYFLDRTAIHGYYNPFSGEGQVSSSLPTFMQPFVISHEMAHQAGIAAEGDANLMAYAVATASSHPNFKYSAYLNIWLYVDRRLHYKDSVRANNLSATLNPLTKKHIATLDSMSRLYDNNFSRYSTELYDSYLKMQKQKEGIKSYRSVVYSAWLLDRKRTLTGNQTIVVP